MLGRAWGLTTTYNHVHDPDCHDAPVMDLRDLHAAIDEAVMRAYGWEDLDLKIGHHRRRSASGGRSARRPGSSCWTGCWRRISGDTRRRTRDRGQLEHVPPRRSRCAASWKACWSGTCSGRGTGRRRNCRRAPRLRSGTCWAGWCRGTRPPTRQPLTRTRKAKQDRIRRWWNARCRRPGTATTLTWRARLPSVREHGRLSDRPVVHRA